MFADVSNFILSSKLRVSVGTHKKLDRIARLALFALLDLVLGNTHTTTRAKHGCIHDRIAVGVGEYLQVVLLFDLGRLDFLLDWRRDRDT